MSSCAAMLARVLAMLALLAGLTACSSDPRSGYAFQDAHDPGVRTVSVPIFENQTFTPGIEARLAEAIVKEIQRTTSWAVVGAGSADVGLDGSLTAMEMRTLSVQRDTGYVQELALTIRTDFTLRDNRTGRVLIQRRNFEAVDTFVPSRPTGERLETGQAAAVQRLARAIVAELRQAW